MIRDLKMGIFGILLILLISVSPILATPTLSINPGVFQISMFGGESIQKNLTISPIGFETSVVVDLYYDISTSSGNNTDGFIVNFSETRFILNHSEPKIILMNITLVPNIKPDTFEINIYAKTEVHQETNTVYKKSKGTNTKYVYIENKTNQTVYVNQTEYVPIYINQTKEIPVERLINHSSFYEDTERINELEDELEDSDDSISFLQILCTLFGFLILIILLILGYMKQKRLIINPFA